MQWDEILQITTTKDHKIYVAKCKTGAFKQTATVKNLLVEAKFLNHMWTSAKAQFRRGTSHVPYRVVRSFLVVLQCPNEFFFSTDFN